MIPAMATIDYFPIQRQFTGYVGVGAGIAPVSFFWREDLSASVDPGARQSGVRYDDSALSPAFMARSGVSLGFDDPVSKQTWGGIYFEVAYTYIPFSAPVFADLAKTLPAQPDGSFDDYNFQTGGFVVKIGFEIILSNNDKRL